jgi:hypothetical protein
LGGSIHVSGEERKVITRKELFFYIEKQGITLSDYISTINKDRKYIETQIWNNSYFANLI